MALKPNSHEETIVKRVSGKHDDDGHGGAWKVAFADFCLALMCLFLVLWVLAARSQEEMQEVVKTANMIEEGRESMLDDTGGPRGSLIDREPLPVGEGGSTTPNSDPQMRMSKTRMETAADQKELASIIIQLSEEAGLAGNLQTVITPFGLRIFLHDTDKVGMFERGSAEVQGPFRTLLRKMGPLFAKIDNQMLIIGHTDSLQYANHDEGLFSNWSLSSQRALAARIQLLRGGMPGRSILQVIGMADRAPLDTTDTVADINRRIELMILTPQQSKTISAMFGKPASSQLLQEGVGSALPDNDLLAKLREQLLKMKANQAQ